MTSGSAAAKDRQGIVDAILGRWFRSGPVIIHHRGLKMRRLLGEACFVLCQLKITRAVPGQKKALLSLVKIDNSAFSVCI